jgi:hypothetical protein
VTVEGGGSCTGEGAAPGGSAGFDDAICLAPEFAGGIAAEFSRSSLFGG